MRQQPKISASFWRNATFALLFFIISGYFRSLSSISTKSTCGKSIKGSFLKTLPSDEFEYGTCGTGDLPIQKANGKLKSRFTEESFTKYLEDTKEKKFHGWLYLEDCFVMVFLTSVQHRMGIMGSVGEIGIHHGKFTLPLVMAADPQERVFASDLFETRDILNASMDGPGLIKKKVFMGHLNDYGLTEGDMVMVKSMDSVNLKPSFLKKEKFHAFRMFSVDGDHTHVMNSKDLLLACNIIAPGGMIILDDYVNPSYMGVASSLFDFLRREKNVEVFFLASNKAFLTTADYVSVYVKALTEFGFCTNERTKLVREEKIFHEETCTLDCCQEDLGIEGMTKLIREML